MAKAMVAATKTEKVTAGGGGDGSGNINGDGDGDRDGDGDGDNNNNNSDMCSNGIRKCHEIPRIPKNEARKEPEYKMECTS